MSKGIENKVLSYEPKDKINIKHRKENKFEEEYAVIAKDKIYGESTAITLRLYYAGQTSYACLWIRSVSDKSGTGYKFTSASGSGTAGGYGYHKASVATEEALTNAGVTLEKMIGGVGDSAIVGALEALAKYMKLGKVFIHHAHA